MKNDELKLVGEKALLEMIWPLRASRPSHRTITNWRLAGRIPFVRIGGESGRVYYEPDKVAEAIRSRWTTKSGDRKKHRPRRQAQKTEEQLIKVQ